MKIIEEAVQNEYDYIEKFGIETYDAYYSIMDNIYKTTIGCKSIVKKE